MAKTEDSPYEALTPSNRVAELRSLHLDYYVDLAKRSETELRGPGQAAWWRLLDSEHDNLVQALEWSIEQQDEEAALRLATVVGQVWWSVRGDHRPGQRWLERALEVGKTPSAARALALGLLGRLVLSNERAKAHGYVRESLDVARQVADRKAEAIALMGLGKFFQYEEGGHAAARSMLEQALSIAHETHDELLIADATWSLGGKVSQEEPEAFRASYMQSLEVYRRLGDRENAAWLLYGLGWGESDIADAEKWALEAMTIARELENDVLILCVIELQAFIDYYSGNFDAAAAHWAAGAEEYRKPGRRWPVKWGVSWMLGDLTAVDVQRQDLDSAMAHIVEASQIEEEDGTKQGIAWSKREMGFLKVLAGEVELGRALLDEGIALDREVGTPGRIRMGLSQLGESRFIAGDLEGARSAFEEAVAISRDYSNRPDAHCLSQLAHVHAELGDPASAEVSLAEALAVLGAPDWVNSTVRQQVLTQSAGVARARGDIDKSNEFSASAVEACLALGHKPNLAHALEERAALSLALGHPEKAARIYGAASALRGEIGVPVPYHLKRLYDRDISELRNAVGAAVFESAFSEGEGLSLDDAVALARF